MAEELFEKVVFLIGAGASRDAGCKLSKGMLESLETAITNIDAKDDEFFKYKDDLREIYHFILASLKYQITIKEDPLPSNVNIEDFVMVLRQLIDKEFILPYPLIGNWNEKITKWELRNGDVFIRFKDFIYRELIRDWTRFVEADARQLLQPVRDFLTTSEDIKLNFFSLNYDLVFENVFNSPEARILDDGFSDRITGEKKFRFWAADFDHEHSSAKINLYKLHGSLDWEYDIASESILIKEDIFDGREPLIIFGSYSKMLSFDPFLYILSRFRELLEQATLFIVIGYSFHDKYINNLLIQQLSKNTQEDFPKKLLVIDPGLKGKTEAQFAEELRMIQESRSINDVINFRQISPDRLKLIPETAGQFYIDYFMNNGQAFAEEINQIEQGEKPFS